MTEIKKINKISLKDEPGFKESMIQDYIWENPSVLGLGELVKFSKERVQNSGGRLDLLFADKDNQTHYEVEIQLGPTDPSHIIRTIEYWDIERKRYPQYKHIAVLVAEDITSRFMNVISLFTGIPIKAIQLSAYKEGDSLNVDFTTIVETQEFGYDEESQSEPTNREYWEKQSSHQIMNLVDKIFKDLDTLVKDYELKYNKFYIGLAQDGLVKNFITFKPKKNYLYLIVKGEECGKILEKEENKKLEYLPNSYYTEFWIRLNNFEEYQTNKNLFIELIKKSMAHYNIDCA